MPRSEILPAGERIVMLEPLDQRLMATTLRHAHEVRDLFRGHSGSEVAGHFDPSEFEDRYETAVVEMLKQKQAGMPPRKEAVVAPPSTVVNLMDALRRSVQAERPAVKRGKATEKVGRQSGKRKAG